MLLPIAATPVTVTIDSNPVITAPISSTTISGLGTGGTITSYLWRQKTGAPATIVSSSTRATSITGLTAGTYSFTLIVTNSLGQVDSNFATIVVNPTPPPANIPPVVSITPDVIELTLPSNVVNITGTAIDSDGTVTSYLWGKVSGTGGTITSPTTANTTINNLSEGVYIYSLTATDNNGATGSATVQITVNAAPAPSPSVKLRIRI